MAKTIFDKVTLNHLSARNRLVRSATWMALADETGAPTDRLIDVYRELAAGGVGTIITGFTSIDAADPYLDGMARLSDDALAPAWSRLVDAVHGGGAKLVVQLALGAYVRRRHGLEPDGVTHEDLDEVVGLMGAAARRAATAGADGVQIHLAHGFWLSRFMSPAYNHRTDEYGGTQQARTLLATRMIEEVRRQAPGLHVTAKVNCSDFAPNGLAPADAIVLCQELAKAGIDSIEVSGNGTSVPGVRPGEDEGYFAPFGRMLKERVDVPVIVVGGWRTIEHMEQALNDGSADLLSLSRPLVREPDLPRRWQEGLREPARCVSCNGCYNTPGHACVFNLRRRG